nr:MTH1187 family thiamine-binding protein [uncultured Halomonas sp.]
MHVIADLSVIPIGVGASVSDYVAACERLIEEAGLNHRLHAHGTNIEGPWDEVTAVVKRCHETLHEMGAPRIHTTLKLGTRSDREQTIDQRVTRVEELLGR